MMATLARQVMMTHFTIDNSLMIYQIRLFLPLLRAVNVLIMALRLTARRAGGAYNGIARGLSHESIFSRRNASAMAVPTQSQAEETTNGYDYSVRVNNKPFVSSS